MLTGGIHDHRYLSGDEQRRRMTMLDADLAALLS
jgi:hypothetical protein